MSNPKSPRSEPLVELPEQLRLSVDESLLLALMQYRMMQRDLNATAFKKQREDKRTARNEFRLALYGLVCDLARRASRDDLAASEVVASFVVSISKMDAGSAYKRMEEAAVELASQVVSSRSRGLMIFINLCAFEPWGKAGWNRGSRKERVAEMAAHLPFLRTDDPTNVQTEFRMILRRMRLQSIPWLKVSVLTLGGVGLGVLTAGLAAPIVGGIIGTSMGLSGAAATSAGLAALGGGSLAAGGLGMAGGTAIVGGVGGLTGAGLAAGTGRATGFTLGQVAADAVLMAVIARLVLADAEHDDAAARKVAESLHQRVSELESMASTMVDRVSQLKRKLKDAEAQRAEDGATIELLRAELQLAKDETRELEVTLQAVESVDSRLEDLRVAA